MVAGDEIIGKRCWVLVRATIRILVLRQEIKLYLKGCLALTADIGKS